jgi:nucleoside-diphosphate-sugar epimerase
MSGTVDSELAGKRVLVTGGTGFVGSALVRGLLGAGAHVRSLDNDWRGRATRLHDLGRELEIVHGDIRDPGTVSRAVAGVDIVCHLAAVNGTEFFYSQPELVLEVAVKGMTNVIDACLEHGVTELVLASTSEVYQTPPTIPTAEDAPLSIPDPANPRYSYAGGTIISERLAINYGRRPFKRALIFRLHNVYGPDMGSEHVIPHLSLRLRELCRASPDGRPIRLPIQGTGLEIRSFVHIDDVIEGILLLLRRGEHLGIYHIGTQEEVTIEHLAKQIGRCFGRDVEVVPGALPPGGTKRRCPDISRLAALGYRPRTSLAEGLATTVRWYQEHGGILTDDEPEP